MGLNMKYISKNLKDFITKETPVFLLMLICICSSVIIVIFSYGFSYQIKQEKEDAKSRDRSLMIEFQDESREIVTKGGVMELLLSLDSSIVDNCYISMEGRFQEEKTDNPAIDNSQLAIPMDFCIKNGKATVAPIEEEMRESNTLIDGAYFTAEQIENAEYVCIAAREYDENSDEEEAMWAEKYSAKEDNTYEVGGNTYTCIGHYDSFSSIPLVPVTTISDDVYIQRVLFVFSKPITRNQYKQIAEIFQNRYGELVKVQELKLKAANIESFYSFLLVLTFVIAILSGVVLACLYKYIMLHRQRRLTIFRLCGLSRKKAVGMFFSECLCLAVFLYVVSTFVYAKVLLPQLGKLFEYMESFYNLSLYCKIGAVYLITILGMLFVLIQRFVRKEIVSNLKGV